MHRERGLAQPQAAPLNDVLVARMLAAAGSTLRDLRNKALLTVAYVLRSGGRPLSKVTNAPITAPSCPPR
jgi:hypothetical protein